MNRRTFSKGIVLGTAGAMLPISMLPIGAQTRRHTNYYVEYFDPITQLVSTYTQSPFCQVSAGALQAEASRIIGATPPPLTKLDTMNQRWSQITALYRAAFNVTPTPIQIGRTVHALSHYRPPQVTLYRANGQAFAQDGTDPGSMNFAAGAVNAGFANFTAALCIAISGEAAGIAFEGGGLTAAEMGSIFGQIAVAEGGLDVAALGFGLAAIGLSSVSLVAIGIGLISLGLYCLDDSGNPGNTNSCATCDCTSSSACGVSSGDTGE